MNLKNNNGFASIDISVSLIIILILIPTIFGVGYNIQKTNNWVNRKTSAISITTDILETAKEMGVANVKLEEDSDFSKKINEKNYIQTDNGQIDISGNEEKRHYSYIGENDVHYRIDISLSYPNDEENDFVKLIKVAVEYPVGNTTKVVEISTVLESI